MTLSVTEATGCGPLEDSGGVSGWDDVKRAFAEMRSTSKQKELRSWAKRTSSLGDNFNPNSTPSLESLNKKGEFEKVSQLCQQGEGYGESM